MLEKSAEDVYAGMHVERIQQRKRNETRENDEMDWPQVKVLLRSQNATIAQTSALLQLMCGTAQIPAWRNQHDKEGDHFCN